MRVRICGARREDARRFAAAVGISKAEVQPSGCVRVDAPDEPIRVERSADKVRVCVGEADAAHCLVVAKANPQRRHGLGGIAQPGVIRFIAAHGLVVLGAVLLGSAVAVRARQGESP